jgi:diguanylate cyclase (GGDEF)-like protein/PAS domain S-box-containing protein
VSSVYIPDSAICLSVLIFALVMVPTAVRRKVGGSGVSYAAIACGLACLALSQLLTLTTLLVPSWSDHLADFTVRLPLRAGGCLLMLLGFLSLVRDLGFAQAGTRKMAETERRRAEEARLQEARLRAIFNSATEYCIIGSDSSGGINLYSDGGERIFGWTADEVVGRFSLAQFYPLWQGPSMTEIEEGVRRKGLFEIELTLARKDGRTFPALLSITSLADDGGRAAGYVGVVKDITDVREAQTALRRERDFVQGIIETGELAIISITLADGHLTLFNHGAELITGYDRQEVLGREYVDVFIAPEDRPHIRQALADGLAGRAPVIGHRQHTLLTRSGEPRIIAWTYAAMRNDAGGTSHVVGFGRDVTAERALQVRLERARVELEQANVELARLAATDPLTGLVNRRQADALFGRELARCRRHPSPLSLIMLDIDHFKAVNDTHGHKVGDAVLMQLAGRLKTRLRATDVVARYGGEEFLLILPDTDRAGAKALAETLRQGIEDAPLECGDLRISLTVSMGVTTLPAGQGLAADVLLRRSDEALYAAKRAGRNRAVAWADLSLPAPTDLAATAN